jgi:hypothetical protein
MREIMKSRRNYESDDCFAPAWNPARELPDWIGSATDPQPIEGSDFLEEIKAYLSKGGSIQRLPVMPADVTGHGDHQVFLIGVKNDQ